MLDAGSVPSVYLAVLKQKIKQYQQQCDDFPQPPVETQQETWFRKFVPIWQHGHYITRSAQHLTEGDK